MVPYNTPQTIRPLEKMVCDFAYSNGYLDTVNFKERIVGRAGGKPLQDL